MLTMIKQQGRLKIFSAIMAALIFVVDQISKSWVLLLMNYPTEPGRIIEVTSFFNLVLTWNHGVSFGMLQTGHEHMPFILSGFAVLVSVALFVWFLRSAVPLVILATSLVIAGALGNVVDRLTYGAVVDFLDFHAFGYHWYAFNVADAAIVIGVAMLFIDALVNKPEKK
jgi:signal peptidase II